MGLFRRAGIAMRCLCRGTTLAAPSRDALLDACEAGRRRQLQLSLARHAADAPVWTVQWMAATGEWLYPNDVVARLRADDIVVELVYAQRAKLVATLVVAGGRVACDTVLARLERRAKPPEPPPTRLVEAFGRFTAQQRRDAEAIAGLRQDLAAQQELVAELREEIAALRARGGAPSRGADPRFRRLKREFGKRYHPDARAANDAERAHRARVFQEFWPVVEEIERS